MANQLVAKQKNSISAKTISSVERMELLLFKLKTDQLYGINVFKVKEIIPCPKLITLPHASKQVRGVAHVRGSTISVLDLCIAMGQPQIEDLENKFVIITEYNSKTQGLLVEEVERIVMVNWGSVVAPPKGSGKENFLTAVTQLENDLIEIIDVEKIIYNTNSYQLNLSLDIDETDKDLCSKFHVLVVDDSSTARKQIEKNLAPTGVQITSLEMAQDALDLLKNSVDETNKNIEDIFLLAIIDIEMPGMDGFTLISKIREDAKLAKLPVVLHSSLSGVFKEDMIRKVGADYFLPKYSANKLAEIVIDKAKALSEK